MSLLSNRRVQLKVTASELRAGIFSRWPSQKRLAQVECPWAEGQAEGETAGTRDLATPLERVLGELAKSSSLRGARLDVELSDALVHFDVAQGDLGGHGDAQLEKVTRACFRELLGDSIDEHELRWQLQAGERHLLMCAAPVALLGELKSGPARHGLRLCTVHTQFQAAWNRHRGLLRSGLGVFASGQDEHVVVAFVREGVVEALSTSSYQAELDDPDAPAPGVDRLLNSLGLEQTATPTRLDAHVDRLIASLGVDAKQLQCYVAVDGSESGRALSSRWQFHEHAQEVP